MNTKQIAKLIFSLVGVTIIFGTIYITGQQILRMDANDPQIQIAEDIAVALSSGTNVLPVLSSRQIDLSQSLASYSIIYDDQGKPLASTAVLHGKTPQVPSGVFDYVRKHGEDRFTWQPEKGVRSATVVTRFASPTVTVGSSSASTTLNAGTLNAGFVVIGRSLREVEIRESNLLHLAIFGWAVSIILIAKYFIFRYYWFRRQGRQETIDKSIVK